MTRDDTKYDTKFLNKLFKIPINQIIHLLPLLRKNLRINIFHNMIRLPAASFLCIDIRDPQHGHDRRIDMPEVVKSDLRKAGIPHAFLQILQDHRFLPDMVYHCNRIPYKSYDEDNTPFPPDDT